MRRKWDGAELINQGLRCVRCCWLVHLMSRVALLLDDRMSLESLRSDFAEAVSYLHKEDSLVILCPFLRARNLDSSSAWLELLVSAIGNEQHLLKSFQMTPIHLEMYCEESMHILCEALLKAYVVVESRGVHARTRRHVAQSKEIHWRSEMLVIALNAVLHKGRDQEVKKEPSMQSSSTLPRPISCEGGLHSIPSSCPDQDYLLCGVSARPTISESPPLLSASPLSLSLPLPPLVQSSLSPPPSSCLSSKIVCFLGPDVRASGFSILSSAFHFSKSEEEVIAVHMRGGGEREEEVEFDLFARRVIKEASTKATGRAHSAPYHVVKCGEESDPTSTLLRLSEEPSLLVLGNESGWRARLLATAAKNNVLIAPKQLKHPGGRRRMLVGVSPWDLKASLKAVGLCFDLCKEGDQILLLLCHPPSSPWGEGGGGDTSPWKSFVSSHLRMFVADRAVSSPLNLSVHFIDVYRNSLLDLSAAQKIIEIARNPGKHLKNLEKNVKTSSGSERVEEYQSVLIVGRGSDKEGELGPITSSLLTLIKKQESIILLIAKGECKKAETKTFSDILLKIGKKLPFFCGGS